MLKNKIVLITGGTGSFGNTVLNRFLGTDVAEIRIFSRDEKKQEDMRLGIDSSKVKFYIGDVRDLDSVNNAMQDVDFVFHAAAFKQVPSCEFYPLEAVKTNILGTENVMNSAINKRVSKVVVLSTDKAVYPIGAMGISKAMAEKLMVGKARTISKDTITTLCATRYGNVMGSRGSVIPLFLSQIKENRALTITDPNMTRFLMSLEDCLDLVLYAFQNSEQGDIFVQKAPACSVGDLAMAMKELFNSKADIRVIGTRHGEKLYESLISREEMSNAVEFEKYYRIPYDNRGLNYSEFTDHGNIKISQSTDYTSHNTYRLNIEEIKKILVNLDFIKNELHK